MFKSTAIVPKQANESLPTEFELQIADLFDKTEEMDESFLGKLAESDIVDKLTEVIDTIKDEEGVESKEHATELVLGEIKREVEQLIVDDLAADLVKNVIADAFEDLVYEQEAEEHAFHAKAAAESEAVVNQLINHVLNRNRFAENSNIPPAIAEESIVDPVVAETGAKQTKKKVKKEKKVKKVVKKEKKAKKVLKKEKKVKKEKKAKKVVKKKAKKSKKAKKPISELRKRELKAQDERKRKARKAAAERRRIAAISTSALLIADKEVVDRILSGEKTWEIRGSNTKKRCEILIARKNIAYGKVTICDSIPLGPDDLTHAETRDEARLYHTMEDVDQFDRYKNIFAWVLDEPVIFDTPIVIPRKKGQQNWALVPNDILP